jgi:hypothetical protein
MSKCPCSCWSSKSSFVTYFLCIGLTHEPAGLKVAAAVTSNMSFLQLSERTTPVSDTAYGFGANKSGIPLKSSHVKIRRSSQEKTPKSERCSSEICPYAFGKMTGSDAKNNANTNTGTRALWKSEIMAFLLSLVEFRFSLPINFYSLPAVCRMG